MIKQTKLASLSAEGKCASALQQVFDAELEKLSMYFFPDSEQQDGTRNLSYGSPRRDSNNRKHLCRTEEFTVFQFAEDVILFTGKPKLSTKREAKLINAVSKVPGYKIS